MNGTLKEQPDKSLVLNSVISTDQKVCMDLEMKSTSGIPLEVRVYNFRKKYFDLITSLAR